MVARCAMGSFMAGMCKPVVFGSSALETEARAILFGMKMAISCGYSQVSLRTDSATLARLFNKIGNLGHGGGYVSEVGSIIDDCVSLMNVGVCFSFLYIPRSFNCSAHLFAQKGIRLHGSWTGRPPDWAESCILTERALFSPSSLS